MVRECIVFVFLTRFNEPATPCMEERLTRITINISHSNPFSFAGKVKSVVSIKKDYFRSHLPTWKGAICASFEGTHAGRYLAHDRTGTVIKSHNFFASIIITEKLALKSGEILDYGASFMSLQPGMRHEFSVLVQESDSTRALGDDTLPVVLSTPRLIAYLEHAAHHTVFPYLTEGQTTVGTWVNVRHLAATPLGMQVRFWAELIAVEGRRLRFRVEAWDEVEKVAEGEHERFIIDRARFEERLAQKEALKK